MEKVQGTDRRSKRAALAAQLVAVLVQLLDELSPAEAANDAPALVRVGDTKAHGLPKTSIANAIKAGQLEGLHIGRTTYVRRSDLAAWAERQRAAPKRAKPAPAAPRTDGPSILAANGIKPLRSVAGGRSR